MFSPLCRNLYLQSPFLTFKLDSNPSVWHFDVSSAKSSLEKRRLSTEKDILAWFFYDKWSSYSSCILHGIIVYSRKAVVNVWKVFQNVGGVVVNMFFLHVILLLSTEWKLCSPAKIRKVLWKFGAFSTVVKYDKFLKFLKIPTILVLLNHCNVKEAVEIKGFIHVFWLHYHSLSMCNNILKSSRNLEEMH